MNKNNFKRVLAFLLAAIMLLSMTACGGGQKGSEGGSKVSAEAPDYLNMDSALPIVKEGTDITLKILVVCGAYYSNLDSIHDVYFVDAYEQKTGVKVEWEEVSSSAFSDQLALKLTTGDLPDVILKGGCSNSTQLKYGKQGFFLDLMENDLLKNYAPNYWALTEKYPEILANSMMPDGEVYSLGMVRNSTGSAVASRMFFNQKWLDKVGLKVPTTSDELYTVLKAFKENDPNGNGRKDEVGMYLGTSHLQYLTFGMFGIGNRGSENKFIDWDEKAEKVRYFPTTENFRDWVEYVSKLYQEGLIEQTYVKFDESNLGNYVKNDVCGVFGYTNLCMLDETTKQNFTYLGGALKGPNGDNDYYGTRAIGSTGAFIITTACEYPEVALRWADYFYSDEGSLLFYYGEEGETFNKLDDGTYEYNDQVLAEYYSGTNSFDGCAIKVSLYGYGNTPTMTKVPFNSADDNHGIALKAAEAVIEDCVIAWPAFTFTSDEQVIIEDIRAEIDKYVEFKRDSWIQGKEQLTDDSWNEFLAEIDRMGLQEVLDVYEAALQRAYKAGFKEGMHSLDEFSVK